MGVATPFAGAVLAGNVMTYLGEGTEVKALAGVARHVEHGGAVVVGFGSGRGYPVRAFDAHATSAGLALEQRFATWDLRPWTTSADFCISVLRVAGDPPEV